MIESEQDRLDMLTELGECVTLNGVECFAIVDREFFSELDASSSTQPIAYVQSIYDAAKGQALVRADGTTLIVRESEPDGTGLTLLRLRRG